MKKHKFNSFGFTLIELIVVIALMISLLLIVIVNFTNISDSKKEQSWDLVKDEIETAALDYFNSNEYLFEGLSDDVEGKITVGKLVAENYLNRVVNPVNNELVNYCSYVSIKKENGIYKMNYVDVTDGDVNCEYNNDLILIEPGAPSLDPEITCSKDGDEGWCKGIVTIELNINTEDNGKIIDVQKTENNSTNDNNSSCKFNDDKSELECTKEGIINITVTIKNSSGKTASWSGTVKIDKSAPTIDLHYDNYSANCKSFKNLVGNDVQYKNTVEIIDNYSGIESTDYNYKYDGDWLNNEFKSNTIAYPRVNTAVLERNGTALKKIYQSYNFLEAKDSTFIIKACDNAGNCTKVCDNAGNCTDYKTKTYFAKSSSYYNDYCRRMYPKNNTVLRGNYTGKCSSNTAINCWLTADQNNN